MQERFLKNMPDIIRPTSSEFDFKAVILLSTVHTDNKIDSDSGQLKKIRNYYPL
jgi:hypothetical protein